METRERIIQAASHEMAEAGISKFRVRRVAKEAGTSIALLYSYFRDRDDVIAAAVISSYRQNLDETVALMCSPLVGVESSEGLRVALSALIDGSMESKLQLLRTQRNEYLAFARHNTVAAEGMAAILTEASARFYDAVVPLEQKSLLNPSMSARSFARIWLALLSLNTFRGEHQLSLDAAEWRQAMTLLAETSVRSPATR